MVEWSNHVKLRLLVVVDLVCVILRVIVDHVFFAESDPIPTSLSGPKFALIDQLLILWSLDCHPSIWTIAFFFYFICPLVDSWFRLLRLALTFQISFWAMGHRTHYRMLHIPEEKKKKKSPYIWYKLTFVCSYGNNIMLYFSDRNFLCL